MYVQRIAQVDATREFRELLTKAYRAIAKVGTPEISTEEAKTALVDKLVHEAVDAHTENHRDYHDITHPVSMWHVKRLIAEAGKLDPRIDELLLILYICLHDVVVKLGQQKGWNENMSAQLAERHLFQLGASEGFVETVSYGITCSIDHVILPGLKHHCPHVWHTIAFFLDLDLLGLGQEAGNFAADTERVWHEFRAVTTREKYDEGRAFWALSFLGRGNIYHSEVFQSLEAPARENLKALILNRK